MELTEPTVGMLATVAGLGLIVTILVEIILRTWQPSPATKDRFGPVLALGVAATMAILGVVFGAVGNVMDLGQAFFQAVLLAIVTAGVGMGIHDIGSSQGVI